MKKLLFLFILVSTVLTNNLAAQTSKIFFDDSENQKVFSINLDGSGLAQILADTSVSYLTVDSRNQTLFWYDAKEAKIFRSSLKGGEKREFLTGLTDISSLHYDNKEDRLIYVTFEDPSSGQGIIHTFNSVAAAPANTGTPSLIATFRTEIDEAFNFKLQDDTQKLNFFSEVDQSGSLVISLFTLDLSTETISVLRSSTDNPEQGLEISERQNLILVGQRNQIIQYALNDSAASATPFYDTQTFYKVLRSDIIFNLAETKLLFLEQDFQNGFRVVSIDASGQNKNEIFSTVNNLPDNNARPSQIALFEALEDTDEDGTPDLADMCPQDAAKVIPSVCGCGVSDADTDSDGLADCTDLCPTDADKADGGACGCGVADQDTNSNGIADCTEIQPAVTLSEKSVKRLKRLRANSQIRRLFGINKLGKLVNNLERPELSLQFQKLKRVARRLRNQLKGETNKRRFRQYKRILIRRQEKLQLALQA